MATCAWTNCNKPTKGNSKYCAEHASLARAAWKAMISEKSAERDTLAADFTALVKDAHAAGMAALAACVPQPMIVAQHADPLNDVSRVEKAWFVPDGLCGFAWIHISPATSKFANWCKKERGGLSMCGLSVHNAYGGGLNLSVSHGNQSIAKKEAYAKAFAEVLKVGLATLDPRVKYCYYDSRLD